MKETTTYKCTLLKQDKPIQQPVSKIGGSPVIFDKIDRPKCSFCGSEMDFIRQFSLKEPLNLFSKYDMAYVFMCPGEYGEDDYLKCETWSWQSGANTVILQSKDDTFLRVPYEEKIMDYVFNFEKVIEPLIDFSDYEADEEVRDNVVTTTKFGGIPAWLQENETPNCSICGKQMKFVAQISSELSEPLDADPSKWDEQEYDSLNFGGYGMGYLFICCDENDHDEGAFLWQS